MRITGGVHRSRSLRAPRGTATRPTSDRVREALFSILGSRMELEDARVLDLYAGSGALALEALSRGAAHATLVEKAKDALDAIAANVAALDLRARTRVVPTSIDRALATLAKTSEPFDLVLLDPPYADVATGSVARAMGEIAAAPLLAPGGVVVLEHAHADAPPACEGLVLESTRRYGDTALSFYSRPVDALGV